MTTQAMAEHFNIGGDVTERIGDTMHGNRGLADAAIAGAMSVGSLVYGAMTRSASAPTLSTVPAIATPMAMVQATATPMAMVPAIATPMAMIQSGATQLATPYVGPVAGAIAGVTAACATSFAVAKVRKLTFASACDLVMKMVGQTIPGALPVAAVPENLPTPAGPPRVLAPFSEAQVIDLAVVALHVSNTNTEYDLRKWVVAVMDKLQTQRPTSFDATNSCFQSSVAWGNIEAEEIKGEEKKGGPFISSGGGLRGAKGVHFIEKACISANLEKKGEEKKGGPFISSGGGLGGAKGVHFIEKTCIFS